MYADDTSISFLANSIPVINERINEDLDSVRTWLAANKLSLNVAKTHCLIIGSGQKLKNIQQNTAVKPSLVIGRETVSMIKDTKYLGVYVDQHLSWDVQISNMVKKISKALGMLRYFKQYLPIKSVQTMYFYTLPKVPGRAALSILLSSIGGMRNHGTRQATEITKSCCQNSNQ